VQSFLRQYADEFLGIPDPVVAAANEAMRTYLAGLNPPAQANDATPPSSSSSSDNATDVVPENASNHVASPAAIDVVVVEIDPELLSVLAPEQRKEFHAIVSGYFQRISEHLLQLHKVRERERVVEHLRAILPLPSNSRVSRNYEAPRSRTTRRCKSRARYGLHSVCWRLRLTCD